MTGKIIDKPLKPPINCDWGLTHMKYLDKLLLAGICLLVSSPCVVNAQTLVAKSPQNRVVLLELYTSEGCSSCPPADHFLSGLKAAGVSSSQLIPLAFHVTYWDYIGWKDRFASKVFDERQRLQAHRNAQRTVYTPQFMMSGNDYRRYASFDKDIADAVKQPSKVDLELSSTQQGDDLQLALRVDDRHGPDSKIGVYFAVIENNLSSEVDDGENEGKTLHHDYVVRELHGPYLKDKGGGLSARLKVMLKREWKQEDLQIVAFAEDQLTGSILQAVRLRP